MIAWRKSKRTFNAKMINVGIGVHSTEIPRQNASNGEAFAFELVVPQLGLSIFQTHCSLYSGHNRKTVALLCSFDKLDKLADVVSRVEARVCQLQTLEEKVAALKKEISEKCIPHPQSSEYQPLPPSLHSCIPPASLPLLQEMLTPGPMLCHGLDNSDMQMTTPAVLQNVSSPANITSTPVECYAILNKVFDFCAAKLSLEGKPGCSAGSKDLYTEGKSRQQMPWKQEKTA